MDQVWVHVIEERASIHIGWKWPVDCVLDTAWLEVRIIFCYSPNFLKSDSIVLKTRSILIKLKSFLDSFSKRASATLSQDCLLGFNFDPWLVSRLLRSILSNTEVAGDNTPHSSIRLENDLITSNAWQYVNTKVLCPLAQPLT